MTRYGRWEDQPRLLSSVNWGSEIERGRGTGDGHADVLDE